MGSICIVKDCPSTSKTGISLFRFPTDANRCRLWINACKVPTLLERYDYSSVWLHKSHYRVCALHFTDVMYATKLKKRLHEDAIPTLFGDDIPGEQSTGVLKALLEKSAASTSGKQLSQSHIASIPGSECPKLQAKGIQYRKIIPKEPINLVNVQPAVGLEDVGFSTPKVKQHQTIQLHLANQGDSQTPKYAMLCLEHLKDDELEETAVFQKQLGNNKSVPMISILRQEQSRSPELQDVHAETKPDVEMIFLPESDPYLSDPLTDDTDPIDTKNSVIIPGDSQDIVKLKQQISKLTAINLKRSKQIRLLQKRLWSQKGRMNELKSIIRDLKKRNVTTVVHKDKRKRRRTL